MVDLSVVLLATGAAAAYAVAANLKHASAGQVPDVQGFTGHTVGRFVRATLTHRLFLLSIGVDLLGAALQILALRRGALSVVQPLLVSGLVIALVLRARSGRRATRCEVLWAVVLTAALSAFLVVARVSTPTGTGVDARVAAGLGVVGLVVAVTCVLLGRRLRGRAGSAAVTGVAVGVIDASVAAMLKSLTALASHGVLAVAASWQLYVLGVLVVTAMFLNQVAFQAGPLSASLPMISSVDPIISLVIGVTVFDETMRHGPVAFAALVGLLGILAAAVVVLSRTAVRQPAAPSTV